ncbi:MAG: DMP19 family protein [Planctomycetota bacterium]
MSKPFLDSYGGQTIQQLIAMKDSHRIDSLVLAVEQALGSKSESDLSEPERVVLAVEAMEREVNNGGYYQFFSNSSREFTPFLVHALKLIGCPKVAVISTDAIAVLGLPDQFDTDAVEQIASELSNESREKLDECDSRYYANDESIEQHLFAYIEEHQHKIQIPSMS